MQFRLHYLCCVFAVCGVFSASAQEVPVPALQSSMASPDDQAMINSIQRTMNYYDGTMNIQIPLYTLSEFGMQVPIRLSYKTSGIKVEDSASSVGLGWNLSVGGKITRMVRRQPDEKNYFNHYRNTPMQMFLAMFGSTSNPEYNKAIDGEPDLFYFETPQHSGIFVFDHYGNAHTIPYQNIEVQWVNKTYFKISDTQGNTYIFGYDTTTRETSVMQRRDEEDITYTSTWLLNNIKDQFDNQISFSYTTGSPITTKSTRHRYTFLTEPQYLSYVNDKYDLKTYDAGTTTILKNPKYINAITSQNTQISFSTSVRTDVTNARKYDQITITTTVGGTPKYLRLGYSCFANGAIKLDAIDEQCGSQTDRLVSFRYNTAINLPAQNSYDFDHWGYYNGKGNTELFPAFSVLGQSGLHRFRGANREPDFLYTQANILTRIDYRTGGYTEYKYELNRARDGVQTNDFALGGLRIKEIVQSDGIRSEKTTLDYTTTVEIWDGDVNPEEHTVCTGVRNGGKPYYYDYRYIKNNDYFFVVFSHSNDNTFNPQGTTVSYARVKERLPNGSYNVYDYLTNGPLGGNNPEFSDLRGTLYYHGVPAFEDTNYFLETVLPKMGMHMPFMSSSRFWRRGLLSQSTHYDANGNQVSCVKNNYSFGTPKAIIDGYLAIPNDFIDHYQWYSEPVFLEKTVTEAGPYNTVSTVEYTYNTTLMVPTQIKQIDAMGNETIKKMTYKIPGGDTDIILPQETTIIKNGKYVSGELTLYKPMKTGSGVVPESKSVLGLTAPLSPAEFTPITDRRYQHVQSFGEYNRQGQVLSYTKAKNDRTHSIIYNANGTIPIAQIDNAGSNQVFHTSFEDVSGTNVVACATAKSGTKIHGGSYSFYVGSSFDKSRPYMLTYWESADTGATWTKVTENFTFPSGNLVTVGQAPVAGQPAKYIDEVRLMPLDAQMTTSTYLPGAGKTSETDVNGVTTYYEYDDFGRLVRVLDNDRNPIKSYEYHSKNQ